MIAIVNVSNAVNVVVAFYVIAVNIVVFVISVFIVVIVFISSLIIIVNSVIFLVVVVVDGFVTCVVTFAVNVVPSAFVVDTVITDCLDLLVITLTSWSSISQ